MRRWSVALLLIALVVLAGCSTSETTTTTELTTEKSTTEAPLTEPSTTTTTTTITTTTTESSSDSQENRPASIDSGGEVNETKLMQTHSQAAAETSWKAEHRNGDSVTIITRNDTTELYRNDDGATWSRNHLSITNDTLLGQPYAVTFAKNTSDFGPSSGNIIFALGIRLSTGNYEWTDTKTVNGNTLYVLNMTEAREEGKELGHYTGRMLVDQQGRIHQLEGEVGDNQSAAVDYRYDFEWQTESVPSPDWLHKLPRVTATKTDAGTSLNVTHTAGPKLPAGTELTFNHDDTEKTVVLKESLNQGDSLHLGLRESDTGERNLVQSRDPLSGEALVELKGDNTQLNGVVTLPDGTKVELTVEIGYMSFD